MYVRFVVSGFHFHALSAKVQLSLISPINPRPSHNIAWVMGSKRLPLTDGDVFDRLCICTVVLLIKFLFHGEDLFICEEDGFNIFWTVPSEKCPASQKSVLFLLHCEHVAGTTL